MAIEVEMTQPDTLNADVGPARTVIANGPKGDKGDDGFSPTVSVAETDGGHRVSITDIDGTKSFDVTNGADGKTGSKGDDGFSPTVSVRDIDGGHRVSITDADGTNSFDVLDGEKGEPGSKGGDGVSPTLAITETNNGHRISITDASGTKSFDVTNGTDGAKGADGTDGISPTITITSVDGGHRVSISDANSIKEFDVLDGKDGSGSGDMSAATYDPANGRKQIAFDADLKSHTQNSVVHITQEERSKWNAKGNGDMAAEIYDPAGGGKQMAFEEDLKAHTSDAIRHITAEERTAWNSKGDGDMKTSLYDPAGGGKQMAFADELDSHAGDVNNPHKTTASQVGADAYGTAESKVSAHNSSATAHGDIRQALAGKETAGSAAAVQANLDTHTGDKVIHITAAERTAWNGKQAKLTGTAGQVVGFDASGNAAAQDAASGGSSAAMFTATLLASGWTDDGSYSRQTVTVTGLKASYNAPPDVDCELTGTDADGDSAVLQGWALVHICQTAENALTALCIGSAPDVNIPIVIRVFE